MAKLLLELGPLLVFFATNSLAGRWVSEPREIIFWSTGAFMVATVASLAASRLIHGRIPVMPLVSGFLVMIFGGMTLYLKNEIFILMKPTILYTLFSIILFAGLATGSQFLKLILGEAVHLTAEGWRILTIRWSLFFLVLAVLNEVVWRFMGFDFWVRFKLFGFLPLIIVFGLAQVPVMKNHASDASGLE